MTPQLSDYRILFRGARTDAQKKRRFPVNLFAQRGCRIRAVLAYPETDQPTGKRPPQPQVFQRVGCWIRERHILELVRDSAQHGIYQPGQPRVTPFPGEVYRGGYRRRAMHRFGEVHLGYCHPQDNQDGQREAVERLFTGGAQYVVG